MENGNESRLSKRPEVNILPEISKFNFHIEKCCFNGGYISCKAFSNSLASFMTVKSLIIRKKLTNFWAVIKSFLFVF